MFDSLRWMFGDGFEREERQSIIIIIIIIIPRKPYLSASAPRLTLCGGGK
jgi:hypothetical protein